VNFLHKGAAKPSCAKNLDYGACLGLKPLGSLQGKKSPEGGFCGFYTRNAANCQDLWILVNFRLFT
jgi:hypothetical protein